MGKSMVNNGGVKVIGQMASLAIIRFEAYENKQEFKRWLQTYGEEVSKERRIWFGEDVDKDARARERAVGKVKRVLFLASEERTCTATSGEGWLTKGMSWWRNGMRGLR